MNLAELQGESLKRYIKDRVIEFKDHHSQELRNAHTNMIMEASAGDRKAKLYIKECIRQELIRTNPKYKEDSEAKDIIDDIYATNWGLGILEKYDTDDVDELMIDGTRISIEKSGRVIDLPERFASEEEAINVIRRVLEFDNSIDISKKNPIRYAERKDGARITASIPPVSKTPYLNIRKFESFVPTTEKLLEVGTITPKMAEHIQMYVKGKANISIIGEMGSGKSTFAKWALGFIPKGERVGILETVFELNPEKLYPDLYFVQLREQEQIDVKLTDLFKLSLRQNVKRVLLGEMRSGEEVFQYIYACTRGHSGSIGTSHSLTAMSLLDDYADMIVESGLSNNKEAMKERIAGAVDIVIKFRKLENGKRVCSSIEEVVRDSNGYRAVPIFMYEYDEENPSVDGRHVEMNKISDSLKKKMNEYGIRQSEINKVLG